MHLQQKIAGRQMTDIVQPKTPEEIALALEEIELRKYEARLGVRKVIYGTMIVGLAGVLIPAAIEGWGLVFQKWQNEAQLAFERSQAQAKLDFEEQSRQEEFLKTHFETAIDENLELRLRFAEYYAYTVNRYDGPQGAEKGNWGRYYEELKRQREELRREILQKERAARTILAKSPDDRTDEDTLLLAELEIKLDWLYDEIEYAEPGREVKPRSSVLSTADETTNSGTVEHYKKILGPDAYGRDTSQLVPSTKLLASVLGKAGYEIERCLTTVELPFPVKIDWNLRQTTTKIRVHRTLAENFRRAFVAIAESDLDIEQELRFAGTYTKRKVRGGNDWSRHAFGAEIDLNAGANQLRMGQDEMTMHPTIVTAFKDAGFAWLGDQNGDGMSFPISSETLDEIARSGFDPATDCL